MIKVYITGGNYMRYIIFFHLKRLKNDEQIIIIIVYNIFIHKRQNALTGTKTILSKHIKERDIETWYTSYSHIMYVHSKTVSTYFIGFVIFKPQKNFLF